MTRLLDDILRGPDELIHCLEHTLGPGRPALSRAADLVRGARHLYLTGIGSSWHAGMAVQSLFDAAGRPTHLVDASELLHGVALPKGSTIAALSRSGKSVEVVGLLEKARAAGARVVAVTNTPDSPLAQQADAVLLLDATFDHNVSITMYTALTLVGGLLAVECLGAMPGGLQMELTHALNQTKQLLNSWQCQLEASDWLAADAATYFLARGGSLSSCHEARLLWEEAAKAPASAMSTGGFRHGPQEIVAAGLRIGIWIDSTRLAEADLQLARDLRARGVKVMVVGQNLPDAMGDLTLSLPSIPPAWQFLIDNIPAQLAAEHLSRMRGVDCDSFVICPYIIESEAGLATK